MIVEDDERLATLTSDYLKANGLNVTVVSNGNEAIRRIPAEQPDLVVLDLMLPGADGLTVCREVRRTYRNPILMLTARTDDMDQVLGLEMGADDYVAKPVKPRLLLARIRALLRRLEPDTEGPATRFDFGNLIIDNSAREVILDGQSVEMTSAEYDLLCCLPPTPARCCRGKPSLNAYVAFSTTAKTAPLMCASRAFAPRWVMTQTTRVELKLCVRRATCLLLTLARAE